MAHKHQQHRSYGIPIAIVVAGAFIAGGLFLASSGGSSSSSAAEGVPHQAVGSFRLPSESDHVRGPSDAKVAIVEFSDFECPFCARLHPTLKRVVGERADVKWVYRHFPLTSIHSRAQGAAVASECIAKLGGNDSFWTFADAIFANQRNLTNSFYEQSAAVAGIDAAAFKACSTDRGVTAEVNADLNEAVQSGGRGTPFAVVVTAQGQLIPFSGALSYEQVRGLVDQALVN